MLGTLPQEFRSDYEALLQDPGNLDSMYNLARRAEQAALEGGPDAGVLARLALRLYERMLLINPELGQIRLRLGELNFWLGRYATAQAYLTQALEDPNLPPAAHAGIEAYLDEIDARLSRHRIDGSLLVGLRHQSNANAAPPQDAIEADIGDEFEPRSDQQLFGSLDLVHRYDLELQAGQAVETRLSTYGAKQIEEDDLDTLSLDLSSGLRFPVGGRGERRRITLRPHAVARTIVFGGELFSVHAGAGLDVGRRVGETGFAALELQVYQQFHPDDRERNGPAYSATLFTSLRPVSWLELWARPILLYDDARSERRANLRYGGTVGAELSYVAPFGLGADDWSTTFSATWRKSRFQGPDVSVANGAGEPDREDERYRLRAANRVPITQAWSLLAAAGYTRNDSNVALREFDDWEVSIGAAWSF